MLNYKDHDVFTWYHHACYRSLKQDKNAALESLEKSLKLRFGNYFMLTSDDDLAFVQAEPEFSIDVKIFSGGDERTCAEEIK